MEFNLILLFAFIIANFIWFFNLNNKFSRHYLNYRGTLWSLLFFPSYFILFSVYSCLMFLFAIFSNFISIKTGLIFTGIGITFTILLINFFNRLKEGLFSNPNDFETACLNNFLKLVFIGFASQVLNTVFLYFMAQHVWNTLFSQLLELLWFVTIFVDLSSYTAFPSEEFIKQLMVSLVYFTIGYLWIGIAGCKKLPKLNYLCHYNRYVTEVTPSVPVMETNSTYNNSPLPDSSQYNSKVGTPLNKENKENNIAKLIDLKKLLDEGIITEEEFTSMKKEILKEGL